MLLLVALAILLAFFLFIRSTSPIQATSISSTTSPTITTLSPVSSTLSSNPDQVDQEWSLINQASVERACLAESKRDAAAQGYDPGVVFSCSCTASETPDYKSYDCKVSALDDQHPASLACTKSQQSCKITSQFGVVYYTFDQLRALSGS